MDIIFETIDKTGRKIGLTKQQWEHITITHKDMTNYLDEIKQAIEMTPEDPSCYSQLGNVHEQMGSYEKAITQYRKALRIQPNLAEAYHGLGLCYNNIGSVGNEIWAYKKALEIKPKSQIARKGMNLAEYFAENPDFKL